MGFLDSILGSGSASSKQVESDGAGSVNFTIRFSPVRLSAMKNNKIDALIKVQNNSDEAKILSVDAMVSKKVLVGFDNTCVSKHVEKKIEQLKPHESTEVVVPIYATNQTQQGDHDLLVTVYDHYLDYSKVIASSKKKVSFRVV